ncbi:MULTISPECIES: response regulator transcription factor [Pedobacter]|uniref:response regulator transcription factor n=1 Tax=Pedobacter TaxID=84567 RepID=UPI0012088FF9|nr:MULTISPECIES: response regulator [Pedobacter]RZJ90550.1 MAG: response regulator [Chryseobacterium sp.]
MSKKIFILEDNDDLRDLYSLILEGEDYAITGFATVGEFMQKSDEFPDLYLLDVMLPDGNGIDVCQRLKASKDSTNIPVIMVSAHEDIKKVITACPETVFIPKPFDIEYLSQQIAKMLGGSESKNIIVP